MVSVNPQTDVAALGAPLRLVSQLVLDSRQPFAAQFVSAGGLEPAFANKCAPRSTAFAVLR